MTTSTYNHEAVELSLYIDNDSTSYQQVQQAFVTIGKHVRRGEYDSARAVAFIEAVVGQCARRYCKEFASPSDRWWTIFDVPTRRAVAEALVDDYEEQEGLR